MDRLQEPRLPTTKPNPTQPNPEAPRYSSTVRGYRHSLCALIYAADGEGYQNDNSPLNACPCLMTLAVMPDDETDQKEKRWKK